MRRVTLPSAMILAGLLSIAAARQVYAAPVQFRAAPEATAQGSGPIQDIYYYRGRYYPYRYRGQYFRHRYYKHGRWHYY
jgi:hypothetical protein